MTRSTSIMMLSVQLQILSVLLTVRDRVVDAAGASHDERGELTGNVIFLAALAVAAAAVAAIIIAKLNSNAGKVPG
jgi:hypothetical protein